MSDQRERRESNRISGDPSRLAFLVFIPAAVLLAYALRDWNGDLQIAKREQITTGEVVNNVREDHNRFDYAYSVGQAAYVGRAYLVELSVGERVMVYYDPLHPSNSQLESFANPGTRPVPILLISIMSVLCFVSLRRWLKKQQSD